jgi:hypothetical protein
VLGDFVFHATLSFLPNVIIGIITVTTGFLLVWWAFEKDRAIKEAEKRKRTFSALKMFQNNLWTWIFDHACTLSSDHKLFEESEKISRNDYSSYKKHVPHLEDIFGIGMWDKQGNRLRGTDKFNQQKFLDVPVATASLYQTLRYGLRLIEPIDIKIRAFPSLLEEIDPDIEKIIELSVRIQQRIDSIQQWERQYSSGLRYSVRGKASEDIQEKSNLRIVGKLALSVALAIDKEIDRLSKEMGRYQSNTHQAD